MLLKTFHQIFNSHQIRSQRRDESLTKNVTDVTDRHTIDQRRHQASGYSAGADRRLELENSEIQTEQSITYHEETDSNRIFLKCFAHWTLRNTVCLERDPDNVVYSTYNTVCYKTSVKL